MTATTYPGFNANTEGLEVTRAFADHVDGKTVLITGVNPAGIGFTTAEALASQSPRRIILAGRTPAKAQESIATLKSKYPDVDYRVLKVDLGSQASVRAAAAEALGWSDVPTIDVIINSAGTMLIPERTLSEDGIELHFATNHIGHWLLSCLLMPKLIKASESNPKGATRIVNVAAASCLWAAMRWSDQRFEKMSKELPEAEQPNYDVLKAWGFKDSENAKYIPLEGYNQSKVANVLFGIAANKRLYEKYGILTLALHPGVIKTELVRNAATETLEAVDEMMKNGIYAFKTQGAGASTSLVAALDPKLGPGEQKGEMENYGAFMMDCQISDQARPLAVSSNQAEKLWQRSEELVKQKFCW